MERKGTLGQQIGPVAFTDVETLEGWEMSELGRVIMPINGRVELSELRAFQPTPFRMLSHYPKTSIQLPSSFRAHEDFPYLQCHICTVQYSQV